MSACPLSRTPSSGTDGVTARARMTAHSPEEAGRGVTPRAEAVRTQTDAQRGRFLTSSAKALLAAGQCGQPTGPGSDSRMSPLCGLRPLSTGGGVLLVWGSVTALQAAPQSSPGLVGTLRSLLNSLGATMSCSSVSLSIQLSQGVSPLELFRGAPPPMLLRASPRTPRRVRGSAVLPDLRQQAASVPRA